MGFQRAPVIDHVPTSSSDREYAREGSGSPQYATDDSSTASPMPSVTDSGAECSSDKSCSNNQEPLNVKGQSLRQRTAQACDKCRERKTKCSGHHPVCTRCTNRGLICEYSIRESRARLTMRPKPIPSPNPFQVNYRSGGGRPTPAYHSRLGISQTNAYDRSPNGYAMLTLSPSTVPRLSSSISSSTTLDANYAHHPAYLTKNHDMSLRGWEIPSPLSLSQASMNGHSERQRSVPDSAYNSGQRSTPRGKDSLYSYDYMECNSVKDATVVNHSAIRSEQRAILHETPSTLPLPDTAYHQYPTQVHDQFSLYNILLTMLSSDGTIASSSGSLMDVSDLDTGSLDLGLRVRGDSNGHPGWAPPHIQDTSMLSADYEAIANYGSLYMGYDDKSRLPHAMTAKRPDQGALGGGTGSQNDPMYPALIQSVSKDVYGMHASERSAYGSLEGFGSQEGFQNSGLYDLLSHDIPDNAHSYIAPQVSDPGNRFEGYKFFK